MHVEIAIGNRDIFLNKHELQRDLSIMCTNVKLWYFVGQYRTRNKPTDRWLDLLTEDR